MNILIITPAAGNTTLGNRITADRWAGILREAGHDVGVQAEWQDEDCDVLVALHARKSNSSIERFHHRFPNRSLIVALTGTDVYLDLQTRAEAGRSVALATKLVALQSRALDQLDDRARAKTSVIYQSAVAPAVKASPSAEEFQICVLGHLREVKDPMRVALAARALPAASRISIIHIGRSIEANWEQAAREEEHVNPRYKWIGEVPHDKAMQLLAASRVMVLSSLVEGGSSAIAEAVVCGVPVLCSEISGNIGMLGPDYPGYFPPKNTNHLTRLLHRAETDSGFLQELGECIKKLQQRFSPETEADCWKRLLEGLRGIGPNAG